MKQVADYYQCARCELWPYLPQKKGLKVLDLGCAAGVMGAQLKQHGYATHVTGIECLPQIAKQAETRLDRVICTDLEQLDIGCSGLAQDSFDVIICADILEHMVDPWSLLQKIPVLLKKRGMLLVSMPNVRHWSVWLPLLLQGRWDYQNRGILDRTHLRFFTRNSSLALIEQSGFDIQSCHPAPPLRRLDRWLHGMSLGMGKGCMARQWLICATRSQS